MTEQRRHKTNINTYTLCYNTNQFRSEYTCEYNFKSMDELFLRKQQLINNRSYVSIGTFTFDHNKSIDEQQNAIQNEFKPKINMVDKNLCLNN